MNQSFFQRYGLLMSTILIFGTIVTLFFLDRNKEEPPQKDNDKWPCYKLSKNDLRQYYSDQGVPSHATHKKLVFVTRIDDLQKPISSMSLWKATGVQYEYSAFSRADNAVTETSPISRLFTSINEIGFEDLAKYVFEDDGTGTITWKKDFDYLLLTPVESKNFANYIAFDIEAKKTDGTSIGAKVQTNPVPPGRPQQ